MSAKYTPEEEEQGRIAKEILMEKGILVYEEMPAAGSAAMSETMKLKSDVFLRMEEELNRLQKVNGELLAALKTISKGEGAYSRDHLTHAANCIEEMKAIAIAAITKAEARP